MKGNDQIEVANDTTDGRIFNEIKKVHPAMAKHIVENDKMMKIALAGVFGDGAINLMDQPMCEKCEKPCFWHGDGAYCPVCGHQTQNPITFYTYLMNYTGKLGEEFDKRIGGTQE